ncbi:MAG: hypothetical protein K2F99_03645 [Muribaculaceae bacterium]|nr:hypothetical protein [Muribaculaceae bacterium]
MAYLINSKVVDGLNVTTLVADKTAAAEIMGSAQVQISTELMFQSGAVVDGPLGEYQVNLIGFMNPYQALYMAWHDETKSATAFYGLNWNGEKFIYQLAMDFSADTSLEEDVRIDDPEYLTKFLSMYNSINPLKIALLFGIVPVEEGN